MFVRLAMVIALATPVVALGQEAGAGKPGRRALLPRAEEIALARSGAPASISAAARIYVFTDSGFVVADSGSSDAVCLVNRSWPDSLEPECFDAEAAATIMPMELHRTTMYHRGVPSGEVDRAIADGLTEGRFRLPARLAVVYMMSAGQRLVSDEGRPVGSWKPHLMIYYPFLTNAAVGHHGAPGLDGGLVVDSGRPTANLMVVVPSAVAVKSDLRHE
jgi:hypothetical protein